MIVYVIHQQQLFSLTLPINISGSYTLSDIDNNKERNLINIVEDSGKWVAYSNKHVKIWKDNKAIDSIVLEDYQYLLLQVKGQEGYLVMYTCPVNDNSFIGVKMVNNMEFFVGSGGDNAISCNNPLIGHKHIKITYKDGNWGVQDLSTQYGTFVNSKLIQGEVQLFHGDVIFILGWKLIVMADTLYFNNPLGSVKYNKKLFGEIEVREKIPATLVSDDEKEVELYSEDDYFVRSPRFMEVIEDVPFKIDQHPSNQEPEDTPLLLTVGPMMTMGASSVAMLMSAMYSYQNNNQNFMSIMPTMVMAGAMLAGTLLWPTLNRAYTKKKTKEKLKKIEDKYGAYLVKKEQELVEISTIQKQILLSNNISPSDCYKLILGKSRSLWMRELHQNDFLALRLGIGRVPLKIKFNYPEEKFQLDEDKLDDRMRAILNKYKYIEGVPVVLSFTNKNIVAMTGKYQFTKNYMDLLILQMVTFHSYYDLKIVLFTNSTKESGWDYLKQMPHLFRNDKEMRFFATDYEEGKEISQYLLSVFNAREDVFSKSNQSGNAFERYHNFNTYYMIITDDYESIKDYPFIDKVLNQDGNLGFSLMIVHPTLANLPTQCKTFIGVNSLDSGGIFENELSKDTQKSFKIELVNQLNMQACSLILNNIPIENKDESFALPKTYGFLEMFDAGNVEQLNSLEKWKINDPINSLAAPVGLAMNGNLFKLDLHEREAGPHGLIAGMTGSGKSEFIITYILSMAINYHPDEVQFVLIDYKGGGLVGAFENTETGIRLPHLAGTITNLDTADINRALASIESELKRRQSLFNIAREKLNEGTLDIYKYQKYYREGLLDTPLSHLFIISDEFAELKSQQPDFMDQLISTARIGRSLGVHLILATQKPSGVVNDQIWSNSRFRICLKVQDANDSNEVIRRPDAANLKDVGRFYLQVGYNEFFAMGQAAYAGVSYIPQDKVYHEVDDSISFINNIGKSIKSVDTPRSVNTKVQGEELPNIVKYLDDLAKREKISVKQLWLEKLPGVLFVDNIKKKFNFKKENFVLNATVGVYDNPKLQAQGLFSIDFTHKGNAVIYSMNEKNTIVNTVIYSLISTYSTDEVNIYALDFDSQTLKIYKDAPQVGDVIFSNEGEKVSNLFKSIYSEIERRKVLFQNYNGSYEFYCKNSGNTLPSIVLIVYGYENFKESYEDEDTTLGKIARDCAKYGVYILLTAVSDRSLRLNTRNSFSQIIPLKLNAPIEYNMLLGKKAPMIADIEGRGVVLVDEEPYEFQTAMITSKDQQNDYIKSVIQILNQQGMKRAPEVKILPKVVTWSDVIVRDITLDKIPIGLETDTLDISYYNATKGLINLVNSNDVGMLSKFSLELIKKLSSIPNIMTMVCDERKYYNDIKSNSFTEVNNTIFMNGRSNPLIVFITGMDKWVSNIPVEIKNDLVGYFSKVQDLRNCYFMIVDRLDDIKSLNYEKWFKQFAMSDHGIFIGRGLNNSTIHSLSTPFRVLSMAIPEDYGYNIDKGIATRIKILEGDSIDE